jgi:hypothetical protein
MKILYSSSNGPEVGLLKSALDDEGIACEIRNEATSANLPGAAFQPEIWIVSEEDYAEACEIRDACLCPASGSTVQLAQGTRSARNNALLGGCIGLILLAATSVICWQSAREADWRTFAGVLTCFGMAGVALLWMAVVQLGGLKPRDRAR